MKYGPDRTTLFAGLNGKSNPDVPNAFKRKHGLSESEVIDLPRFNEVYQSLPIAIETEVAWQNPWTGEMEQTDRFNALIDPDKVERLAADESVDPLWNIPTDSYGNVNPPEIYFPAETAIAEAGWEDEVFGEVRQYKTGGEVHMDVMFSGQTVDLPDGDDCLFAGFTSGYDFFGGTALYAEGYAMDTACDNSMRSLTDKKSRRHIGNPEEDINWWEEILTKLGGLRDHLAEMIEFAMEFEMDFRELPFDLKEFYELNGYPSYMAQSAAAHARTRTQSGVPWEIDLWAAHAGATYALTHEFRGGESGAIDGYVQTANDMVQNPAMVAQSVQDEYESRENTREGDDTSLEGERGIAQIESWEASISDRKDEFEQNQTEMRSLLTAEVEA